MKREQIIKKLVNFIECSSDAQVRMIDEMIKKLTFTKKFFDLYEPPSNNFTTNGMQGTSQDIEEGNFGTLYRSDKSE